MGSDIKGSGWAAGWNLRYVCATKAGGDITKLYGASCDAEQNVCVDGVGAFRLDRSGTESPFVTRQ